MATVVTQASAKRYAARFESGKFNDGKSTIKPRKGKTAKDRKSGANARRISNLEARASWRNEGNSKRSLKSFPFHTCNGKKNRTQVTGKGNTIIVFTYKV